MAREFEQVAWDETLRDACRQLIRASLLEDLADGFDWTTMALAPPAARGEADVRSRQSGVMAGAAVASLVIEVANADATWTAAVSDGDPLSEGAVVGTIAGAARDLLTVERTLLNLLGRMCGVATLTRRFVDAVGARHTRIYDTRKTTPGHRRLEKFAVRCGGGWNHRLGLHAAVMVKDNHLAQFAKRDSAAGSEIDDAIDAVRGFVEDGRAEFPQLTDLIIEVEVDSIEQLRRALPKRPDIVLLDNMTPTQLREAVAVRDALAPAVRLEASGGVRLENVSEVAATGVDRISVGALTHSAPQLDLGLDWK